MPRYLFDIETNGLLDELDRVHCIVLIDLDTGMVYPTHPGNLTDNLTLLSQADYVTGQNIMAFDLPALRKVYPLFSLKPGCIVRDTLVMSQLIWLDMWEADEKAKVKDFPPQLKGRHGLEAWGYRLGERKGDFGKKQDWSTYTPEMLAYCIQDTKVNLKLWEKIESKKYPENVVELEHRFHQIMLDQEAHGFAFDKSAAIELYGTLGKARMDLERQLKEMHGGWYTPMKRPEYYYVEGYPDKFPTKTEAIHNCKINGIPVAGIKAGPPAQRHTEFNPGSRDHASRVLIEKYGWKPKQFGKDGKPTLDESVLEGLVYPEAKLLLQYLMVEKRIGMLAEGAGAWLKLERNGRIHGRVNSLGTVTTRVTHSNPNMSQVPAIDKPYGKESRGLFRANPGHVLVGADASGIQLRALAHYLYPWDGGKYCELILKGDIHTFHQEAFGFATRDMAKTFIYAFLLGAGAGKAGEIAGRNRAYGQMLIDQGLARIPALGKLKAAVVRRYRERGYLTGLDGRLLPCRSDHKALSSLLQGFEACIMKTATVKVVDALGWEPAGNWGLCGFFHDELQISCDPSEGDNVGKLVVQCIEKAGEELKSQCPLTGAYRIGTNWCETH